MKDRLYMVLAFIGFIILAIVTIMNYDIKQDEKPFAVGDFYTPQTVRSYVESSVNLYAQMTGRRERTCPEPGMHLSTYTKKTITSLFNANERNAYGVSYMFILCKDMSTNEVQVSPTFIDRNNIADELNADSGKLNSTSGGTLISSVWDFSDDSLYIEIIAPFQFTFLNINTTDNDTIQILNSSANCRITFDNVANWYCAGPPGTQWLTGSGTAANSTDWIDHGVQRVNEDGTKVNAAHCTVVGKTSNADVKGGIAGSVIGYADVNTTVTIEKYTGTTWEVISIYDFIMDRAN